MRRRRGACQTSGVGAMGNASAEARTDGQQGRDRGEVIGGGLLWLAKWALCVVAIAAGAWVLGTIAGKLWVVLLPVALAVVVTTILWPATRWLTAHRMRPSLAATITLVGFLAVVAGVIALIVPSVADQAPQLADKATAGVNQVRDWAQGPPLNIRDEQLDSAVDAIVSRLQSSGTQIANGVFTGVSTATSVLITIFLVLVLVFFFLKDGPRLLPWMHVVCGNRSGRHIEAVLERVWGTLGGFIRTQAIVSFVDAALIGAALFILDVPLALVLSVITFVGGFIPMVGAFVAGALAVLVALVGNGFTTALIVLGVVIAVQQLEGNVLQPVLQSRSMELHPVIVLLAVTAGGSLYGITGAFLAVPVVAMIAVVLRYLGEQIDAVTRPSDSPECETAAKAAVTPEPSGDSA
ncbi:putative PurR-regulated permease PerM [Nocardia ignorata]|uniref:Putative PurR-regulated permease PerM n=2 Tax=Nocardia ignorata TaxID=145285 RepID=A0A4R6PRX0_NOCIG|nr:putative PurR-regulated permease PerM [Nocardia ignorata]